MATSLDVASAASNRSVTDRHQLGLEGVPLQSRLRREPIVLLRLRGTPHLVRGIFGQSKGHIGHSAAALQGALHGVTHQVCLHGCQVLRSSALPEFVHVFHAFLKLLPEKLQVLLRHSAHPFTNRSGGMDDPHRIAGRLLSCFLRAVP